MFHQDSSIGSDPPDASRAWLKVLKYSPYSPDPASDEYHLFLSMANDLLVKNKPQKKSVKIDVFANNDRGL